MSIFQRIFQTFDDPQFSSSYLRIGPIYEADSFREKLFINLIQFEHSKKTTMSTSRIFDCEVIKGYLYES